VESAYNLDIKKCLTSSWVPLAKNILWALKHTCNRLQIAPVHVDWLIMVGWDWHLRTAAITGLLFIPRVICERGEPWWWRCRLGITPNSSTRALWQSYQQRHLGKVGGMDEGVRILYIQYLWYVNESLICHQTLRHGSSGFTSRPKEGVLRVFIDLKIHHLGRVWTRGPWVQWQAQ
jgi:hypothetical protein